MSLAKHITDALKIADELRSNGMPKEQAIATIEQTVRQTWPFTREWMYLCAACGDYGLVMHSCDGQAGVCGRRKLHLSHEYGIPCHCAAGARFEIRERTTDDAITAAATTRKMTRAGR